MVVELVVWKVAKTAVDLVAMLVALRVGLSAVWKVEQTVHWMAASMVVQ